MNTLRLGSGRQYRSAALVEMPLPLAYDAELLPGARVLGEDGQIYESMRDLVSGLYEWQVRAQGERGPAVELQKSATHLQWRVEGSTGAWTDLVPLVDITGPAGPAGPGGPPGAGLSFRGSVATVGDLPTPSTLGYAYLVEADDHLWIYSGTAWLDAGPIQGPPGPIGPTGNTGPAGAAGADGAAVQLQKTTTEIQWRLTGETTWQTLVLLDDIKGPVGDTGLTGPPGAGFSYQGTVATVANLPTPSTQGFAFQVVATGDLHINNGTAWVNAGPLRGPQGLQGDQGIQGPPGAGFSYQGTVATVANLPTPSTQGFAFQVVATGDLHINNGTAWVNAGPLRGPQGLQGDQGIQGPPGAGFSYQGTVATVANLPTPSTQGFAFQVVATGDLHINNGTAWVNAGPLRGPQGLQGDQGIQGIQGNPGTAATIGLGTVTTGAAGSSASITNSGTSSAAVFNFTIPRGDTGAQGNQGPAGPVAGTTGQAVWNNGGSAAGAAGLTFDSSGNINRAAFSGTTYQFRQTVTASSSTYTLDVTTANEFVTAAVIASAITINLSNLASIPSGYVWRGVLSFSYTSGTITWFSGNTGYTVKWDGGTAMTPTVSDVETVVISVVGGGSTIEIAPLKGRA